MAWSGKSLHTTLPADIYTLDIHTTNKIRKNAVPIQNTHYEMNKFQKRLGKKIILDCADWSSLAIVFKSNYCFVLIFVTVCHSGFIFFAWLLVSQGF